MWARLSAWGHAPVGSNLPSDPAAGGFLPHLPAPHRCCPHPPAAPWLLTFFGHADLKALLEPTVLAAVAGHLVDLAVLVAVAGVHHVFLDASAKESLKVVGGDRDMQVMGSGVQR